MILLATKIIFLTYLGFGFVLFLAQNSLLYFPVAENGSKEIAHEYLISDGESIKVWVVRPGKENAVVYFGGNAEDVTINAAYFHNLLPDHTTYLINYRGYGGSSGTPSQANLFADALNIYDLLRERHPAVSVIGRSLGSGVATFLASKRPVQRLLLVTPYDSVLAIAQSRYPIYPVSLMLHDRYESVESAPFVKSQTLLLMAEHDDIIPSENSLKLAEAFSSNLVSRVVIGDTDHNGLTNRPQYWAEIGKFLDNRCC